MKVILSRKGMDSEAGGIPSPILPDGTLLSLPIPDNTSGQKYSELYYNGQSLQEIIHQLKPRFNFSKNPTCHLDPDIYNTITYMNRLIFKNLICNYHNYSCFML